MPGTYRLGTIAVLALIAGSVRAQVPDPPTNLVATTANPVEVGLAWQDVATNEVGYSVERSTDGTNFTQLALIAADSVSFVDTNLVAPSSYLYRVRGTNSVGVSAYSNIATATTWAATNTWISTSDGVWQQSGSWSLGFAPDRTQSVSITNVLSKTVTNDAAAPQTMIVNDLTIAGATNTLLLSGAGPLQIQTSMAVDSGGVLLMTNSQLIASGLSMDGGNLVAAGGTNALSTEVFAGFATNSTGSVALTGGALVLTNANMTFGYYGAGAMTISNGTLQLGSTNSAPTGVFVGLMSGADGYLAVLEGAYLQSGHLSVGERAGATGLVWMAGGQWIATNNYLVTIGGAGVGEMDLTGGQVMGSFCVVGSEPGSSGLLQITGGTNSFTGGFSIGGGQNATGTVTMSGGELVATNQAAFIGNFGVGQMTVNDGTCSARTFIVGANQGSRGALTIAGGVSRVFSNLMVGSFGCAATGAVTIAGGQLFVTNAAGNAVLEIRSGTVQLTSGTLTVDKLVVTNACGHFARTGGVLITGTNVLAAALDADGDGIPNGYEQSHGLDPLNPANANLDTDGDGLTDLQEFLAGTDATNSASFLGISGITSESNDIRVTWKTSTGKTNALQRSAGTADGFSTNFATIFSVTNTTGTTTNYLDHGAVTNAPAYYYRVRLVP